MSKIVKYIIGGLVLFLLILAYQNWRQAAKIERQIAEILRLQKNQEQLIAENQHQTNLILTQKEVTGKVKRERDSLAKALKIRPKQIIKYVDRIVKDTHIDTVSVMVTPYDGVSWKLTDADECMIWEGDAKLDGLNLGVERTKFEYTNKIVETYYWTQKRLLWLIPLEKKQYYQDVKQTCGESYINSVEIKRKK